MNRIILLTITALILTGCGSSGSDDDENQLPAWCLQQYSTESTVIGLSGTVLEPSNQMYVTPQEVDLFHQEVLDCATQTYSYVIGATINVRYESFSEMGSIAAMGFYTISPYPTVLINTDDVLGRRSCSSDEANLKHEFLHHIIWTNNLPLLPYPDGHPAAGYDNPHDSPLFNQCVPAFIDASLGE